MKLVSIYELVSPGTKAAIETRDVCRIKGPDRPGITEGEQAQQDTCYGEIEQVHGKIQLALFRLAVAGGVLALAIGIVSGMGIQKRRMLHR